MWHWLTFPYSGGKCPSSGYHLQHIEGCCHQKQKNNTSWAFFQGWVHFFRVAVYGAVFWICLERCWWCRDVFLIPVQGLPRAKGFFWSSLHPTSNRAGVAQGVGTARTGHPSWPQGYSRPCVILISAWGWGKEEWWYLCSQVTTVHGQPCFPGDTQVPACPGKGWMNSLFCFACTFCFNLPH